MKRQERKKGKEKKGNTGKELKKTAKESKIKERKGKG